MRITIASSPAVDAHIPELAKVDPRSMTFRYTIGKHWERLLPLHITHVAYAELALFIEETSSILEAASSMIAEAVDYATAAHVQTEHAANRVSDDLSRA